VVSCVVNTWHRPARLPQQNPPGPTPRPLFLLLFVFPSLFRLPNPPNSNDSPTSTRCARNSFVSPTSAKKRGVGGIRGMTNRSISEFRPTRSSSIVLSSAAPLFSVLSVSSVVNLFSVAFSCSPRASIGVGGLCYLQSDVYRNVGAPTFSFRHSTSRGVIRSGGLRRDRAWRLSWRATRRRSGRCSR